MHRSESCAHAAKLVVGAHYSVSRCDWWIVEYDPNSGYAWGYVNLNMPDFAEFGMFSLPELETFRAGSLTVERDCSWEPREVADLNLPGLSKEATTA